jgi:hypothetical protein
VHTYRSPSEDYLRRLLAPDAGQELVDNVLGNVHLHGLHRRPSVVLEPGVAIRSPDKGNAARGKQRSRHVGVVGVLNIEKAERGVKLAPGCC